LQRPVPLQKKGPVEIVTSGYPSPCLHESLKHRRFPRLTVENMQSQIKGEPSDINAYNADITAK
jgi:hypothetical protein